MNNGSSDILEAQKRAIFGVINGLDDERLDASHFTDKQFQELFRLAMDMKSEGIEISPKTVAVFAQSGGIENATATITRLTEELYNNPDLFDVYVNQLLDFAERRRVETSLVDALRLLREKAPIDEVRTALENVNVDGHLGEPIKFFTGPELAKLDTRIVWAIDEIIVHRQPLLTVGPKKVLKTNIGIDKVLSMATGVPFLGEFKVPRSMRVGFMSAESGQATIKETAHRVAMAKGFNGVQDIPDALFAFETPMISVPRDCERIRRIIETHELEFLTIDPSYLTFAIGDEGKNVFRMGELLSPLSKIIEQTGCGIELMHHARKSNGRDGQPLDLGDESYSGFSEWARQWFYLSRREPYDETRPGSHRLWLRYGGSVGHNGLIGLDIEEGRITDQWGRRWDVRLVDAKEIIRERKEEAHNEKQAVRAETIQRHIEAVREAVQRFPNGESLRTIAAAAKLSNDAGNIAIQELVRLGEVETCTFTKNKRPLDGFKPVGQWDN